MINRWLFPLAAALCLLVSLPRSRADEPVNEGQTATAPEINADTSEVPDLDDWGKKAGALCVTWYPRIADLLMTPGYSPPKRVEVVFRKQMNGIAFAAGDRIQIAADWVRKHPEDTGMVIHELTHVVQRYPRSRANAGWLVEGIADYVRHSHFEPEAPMPRINPRRASYRDSYKTTAAFLTWIEKTHDPRIVPTLNLALREGRYRDEIFESATGRNLDELWQEFLDSLEQGTA